MARKTYRINGLENPADFGRITMPPGALLDPLPGGPSTRAAGVLGGPMGNQPRSYLGAGSYRSPILLNPGVGQGAAWKSRPVPQNIQTSNYNTGVFFKNLGANLVNAFRSYAPETKLVTTPYKQDPTGRNRSGKGNVGRPEGYVTPEEAARGTGGLPPDMRPSQPTIDQVTRDTRPQFPTSSQNREGILNGNYPGMIPPYQVQQMGSGSMQDLIDSGLYTLSENGSLVLTTEGQAANQGTGFGGAATAEEDNAPWWLNNPNVPRRVQSQMQRQENAARRRRSSWRREYRQHEKRERRSREGSAVGTDRTITQIGLVDLNVSTG